MEAESRGSRPVIRRRINSNGGGELARVRFGRVLFCKEPSARLSFGGDPQWLIQPPISPDARNRDEMVNVGR